MNPTELYGYPQFVLDAALLIGVCLAVVSPRMLFFAVLTLLVVADWKGYVYSRFESIGYYLNVFDLLIAFGLISASLQNRKGKQPIDFLWYLAFADIILGFLISYMQLGMSYDVLRLSRYALNVPLLWLIGQRCINTREDARIVLYIVLFGCFVQSVRQCLYVAYFEDLEAKVTSWRTIRFLNAGFVVVPFFFLLKSFNKNLAFKVFLYVSLSVSIVALVLTQTRSLWIPQALVMLVGGWVLARNQLFKLLLPAAVGLLICGFAFASLVPNKVDIVSLFLHGRITDFSSGNGREEAIYFELLAWLDGNFVFGQGLAFMYSHEYVILDNVGWGHNGYTAYLSTLGIVGFVLFGILIPKQALANARGLWNRAEDDLQSFGLMTRCLIWVLIIESMLTPGLLSGISYSLCVIFLGGASSLIQEPKFADADSNPSELTCE